MIAEKFVDLYARNSGIRDKLVAERDVVLTYALQALQDAGVIEHLAFKGGTCLRKFVFGSSGRFSEDLDFTLHTELAEDDVLVQIVNVFNAEYRGIAFRLDDYYKADADTSFGGDISYRHAWNDAGHFRLQVSLREKPTSSVVSRPMKHQGYFSNLEFQLCDFPTLATIEMIAEKVRAAYQRSKVRDLYDLHRLATTPFDVPLLRSLVVLKLWQVRDPFDPEAFFRKLRGGTYDWQDLRRLLRASEVLEQEEILKNIETRYQPLLVLTDLERELVDDARSGWNDPLADRLRQQILTR